MRFPLIVVIKDDVVFESKVATPENCEQVYLDTCREHISNFDQFSPEDIETIVDEGYAKMVVGSVCLHWVDDNPE